MAGRTAGNLSAEAREVLSGFAARVDVIASQLQGPRSRKAAELAEEIRSFDGTKAKAVEILEGQQPPTPEGDDSGGS